MNKIIDISTPIFAVILILINFINPNFNKYYATTSLYLGGFILITWFIQKLIPIKYRMIFNIMVVIICVIFNISITIYEYNIRQKIL